MYRPGGLFLDRIGVYRLPLSAHQPPPIYTAPCIAGRTGANTRRARSSLFLTPDVSAAWGVFGECAGQSTHVALAHTVAKEKCWPRPHQGLGVHILLLRLVTDGR